jgi:tungstate transport system substrate-binding protein
VVIRTILLLALAAACGKREERFVTLASTTSTENSGLFGHLLPRFEARTGISVRVVAVGTGQAIRIAEKGDADVLLVHDRAAEDEFVKQGFGVARHDVMYNDYVLVGPKADPAGVAGGRDAVDAMKRIAAAAAPFVSRGDDSGTHRKERALWKEAGVDPAAASGTWYREAGAGMGATINVAVGMGAYVLSDRATWASFKNRGDLDLAVEGDRRLFNPYGIIAVNPVRHPHVKSKDAQAFVDWILSAEGREAIASFQVDGKQVFFPSESG